MPERLRSTRKNRMTSFVITELSAVDSPAQVHARAVIMKRHSDDPDNSQQEQNDMQKIMSRDDDPPRAFHSLEDACAYLKANGMSASDAMSAAARMRGGALLKQYNDEGERQVQKALDTSLTIMRTPPAVREFENLIREIKDRDGCDSVTALRRARAEDPELFAQYQAA